ncbi:dinitrogenase iron-molybdenum cofactor biosynthesis protein [bacterium]|nr:dinitrogenase iron-molybdenum cofactor biosynthesis protein [bacterium]
MTIALTTRGTDRDAPMDPRFGRTPYFLILDEEIDEVAVVDNTEVAGQAHGAGPRAVRVLVDHGVDVLITGNGPGGNAAAGLQAAGVTVYVGAGEMTAAEALQAYHEGKLPAAS